MKKHTENTYKRKKKDQSLENMVSQGTIKRKIARDNERKRDVAEASEKKMQSRRKKARIAREPSGSVPKAEAITQSARAAASKWEEQLEECRYNADLLLQQLQLSTDTFASSSTVVLRTADTMFMLEDLLNPSVGKYRDAITAEIKLTAEPRKDLSESDKMEEDVEDTAFDKLDVFSKRKMLALYIAYTDIMGPQLQILRGTFRSVSASVRGMKNQIQLLQDKIARVAAASERTIKTIVKEVDTQRGTLSSSSSGVASAAGFAAGKLQVS